MPPAPRHLLGREFYDQLRDALMLGELRPGDRLTFRDVAARFQASVTPVREALLQLVAEGVLHAEPGRTITVPRLTQEKFVELRNIRLLLEPHAAELAVRRGPTGLVSEMYRLYAELLRNRERADIAGCMRAHRDLHFTLYEATGMPTLVTLISTIWLSTSPYVVFLYSDPASGLFEPPFIGRGRKVDEHLRIIEAVSARDGAGVRAAVERDIPLGEEIIFKYLLGGQADQTAAKPAMKRASVAEVAAQ
jgi:DNA-binding GntR family transcriptional regulator